MSAKLTAYFDEDSDERVYLVGGWLGKDGVWAELSRAWTDELRSPPTIAYFKNNDAMGLKNQFAGWTEESRDGKLLRLAEIIANRELVGLVGGVGIAKFKTLCDWTLPYAFPQYSKRFIARFKREALKQKCKPGTRPC
jgi:hypothetical protein